MAQLLETWCITGLRYKVQVPIDFVWVGGHIWQRSEVSLTLCWGICSSIVGICSFLLPSPASLGLSCSQKCGGNRDTGPWADCGFPWGVNGGSGGPSPDSFPSQKSDLMAYTDGGSMNIAGPYVSSSCSHRTEVKLPVLGRSLGASRVGCDEHSCHACLWPLIWGGAWLGSWGRVCLWVLSCIFCWTLERAESLVAALVTACVLSARVAETGTRCLRPCTCQRGVCTIQSGLRAAGTGRVV